MDLLLFLIRKHEIDIYDIPIELVLDQYLHVLDTMQEVKLEIAGDFFVMAATLMEIKSRLLLPKQRRGPSAEDEEEDTDPRWELVHQLIEYKKFKDAADTLERLSERASLLKERDPRLLAKSEREDRPLRPEDRISVWNAYNMVLRRLSEKLVVGEIQDDAITVVDQMEMLIGRLQREPSFSFASLFPNAVSLRRLVATFLAVLELTRLKRLRIDQTDAFADFIVTGLSDGEPLEFEQQNKLEPLSS